MDGLKIKAKFIGMNGQVGYLTGETYNLILSRHEPHQKFGDMLVVDRDKDNNHDVSSETNWKFENDEDFHNHFQCEDDIDFSSIKYVKPVAKAVAAPKDISERVSPKKKAVKKKKAKK